MLLIVGLDGASWNLLAAFLEQGRMPHLRALQDEGSFGPLRATMPPATFPSWTTFMTGVNPGRHGIFDFTRRERGAYRVNFTNASFRKAPTVWQMLSKAGRRVAVLGLPGTYPPEAVNGVMLSGFDTPVTTRADASFAYPPEFAELVESNGGFPFADFQEFRIGPDWHRRALDLLLRGIEIKTRLAETLLQREPWDCFMLLFGESDTVAHHFWHFHDGNSPRHDARSTGEYGDAIGQVYSALDGAIGRLKAHRPDADILIVSDHGFGGAGAKVVYLNQWLAQAGWLRFDESDLGGRIASFTKRQALRWMPFRMQRRLFRWKGGRLAGRLESQSRFRGIDWSGTAAFSEELNYFPSLWLNLREREPQGLVSAEDYERTRAALCADIEALRDPEHGRPIMRRAWRREELYDGPWVSDAPDIVLELNDDAGYSYNCLPSPRTREGEAVRRLAGQELAGGKLAGMSGSHRRDGVFLVAGPSVSASGWTEGAEMADMTPTILNLCGLAAPENFDGETLRVVVSRSTMAAVPAGEITVRERVYKPREEAEIAARLADLGYME